MRKFMAESGKTWALVFGMLLLVPGCLTAQQKVLRAENNAAIVAAGKRMRAYEEEAKAVWKDVESGKLPRDSGVALVRKIAENQTEDRATLKRAEGALAKLAASEAPWWAFIPWEPLIYAGLGALGLGTPLVLKNRRVTTERNVAVDTRRAVISGVDAGAHKPTKEAIEREAIRLGVESELHRIVKPAA